MNHSQEPVDLRVRRTHKLLWEALLSLMDTQEFETISVKEICDRAMIHRTTFYKHYEDKYDLFRRGMQESYEMLVAESDLIDQDSSVYTLFFVHVATHERLYRVMLCGTGGSSFQSWVRDHLAASLGAKMQRAEKEGKPWLVPLPLLAHFYAGALVSTLTWWLSNDLPFSPEQMGHYMKSLLIETFSHQGGAR